MLICTSKCQTAVYNNESDDLNIYTLMHCDLVVKYLIRNLREYCILLHIQMLVLVQKP